MPSVPSGEQNTLPFGRLQSERGELPVPAPSLNPRVSKFTFTLPSPSVALIKLTHLQIMLTRHALPQHECTANVFVHGACDNSTCTGIEYCHLHAGTQYACWEVTPSAATASMVFTQLRTNDCGYCTSLLSHYPCESCCGDRASASWSGSYITTEPDRKGGGVFMGGDTALHLSSTRVTWCDALAPESYGGGLFVGDGMVRCPRACPPSRSMYNGLIDTPI